MKADSRAEKEIRALLNEFDRASREQDMEGLRKIFMHDGIIFVGSESGALRRGTEQVREFFETLFSGPITYGFRWKQIDISLIGDAAWAFADCDIETISAAGRHSHPYRVTGVFQRQESGWKWVHYHGSEPAG